MTDPRAKEYDVMQDIVVRAGIRDRIIADLSTAVHLLSGWRDIGAECAGYKPSIEDAEAYARMAKERCDRDWKKL
jgi:hypothetical protein